MTTENRSMTNLIDLSGRTVVVTGACGILGSVFVAMLTGAGARVIGLDLPAAIDTHHRVNSEPGEVHYEAVDLADPDDVTLVANGVIDRFGTPYGLVNNAASKGSDVSAFMKDALEITPRTWREVTSVNLDGTFFVTQAFGRAMVTAGRGSILFIGSIYGERGPDPRVYEGSMYLGQRIDTPPVYSATKAGLSGLTRYLAAYWGGHGVRVNCICPGGVSSGQNDAFTTRYSSRVPMRRMARPEDIAAPVVFFLSDAAGYINGQTLLVDGGLSAW